MKPVDPTVRAVLDWVSARHPDREGDPTPTTPLVEDGWLSSLDVLDLLLFLEQLTGRPPALAGPGPSTQPTRLRGRPPDREACSRLLPPPPQRQPQPPRPRRGSHPPEADLLVRARVDPWSLAVRSC